MQVKSVLEKVITFTVKNLSLEALRMLQNRGHQGCPSHFLNTYIKYINRDDGLCNITLFLGMNGYNFVFKNVFLLLCQEQGKYRKLLKEHKLVRGFGIFDIIYFFKNKPHTSPSWDKSRFTQCLGNIFFEKSLQTYIRLSSGDVVIALQ